MNAPLLYTVAEACSVAHAGRTAIYAVIRDGAVHQGQRPLFLPEDLRRWIESYPTVHVKSTSA